MERVVGALLLLLALAVRGVDFPHRDECRDVDEPGYLKGSLALLEGLPPGYKAAPAGPNTWVGWAYLMADTARHVVIPDAGARLPLQLRPLFAVDRTLFDHYHDLSRLRWLWVVTQLLLTLAAVVAAYRYGIIKSGLAGGLLFGGTLALTPVFVSFTMMSRPYATAWAFGVLALYAAATRTGTKQWLLAGLLLGLAVASRVEMLLFAPVVAWELWDGGKAPRAWRAIALMAITSAATAQFAAPWLLTNLIGNLRTIATVRLGPSPAGPASLPGTLAVLAWREGLLGPLLLLPAAFVLFASDPGHRRRRLLLAVYAAALVLTLGKGTVFLHQQGPVLLALVAVATVAVGAAAVARRLPAPWPAVAVAAILVIPLGQVIRAVRADRRAYAPDPSTAWLAAHVPAGATVYTWYALNDPLPTADASRRLWDEVTDDAAWRRKFESGLDRFGLAATDVPHGLSEENLVQERGNRREYFILGGRPRDPEPRYDVRLYDVSPIFGLKEQDVWREMAETGGTVVWRGALPPEAPGAPVAAWTSADGTGTFIFQSAEKPAAVPATAATKP